MATGNRHYPAYNRSYMDTRGISGGGKTEQFGRNNDSGSTGGGATGSRGGRPWEFSTASVTEHKENKKLYIENMRLWDCLTLMRSDNTMSMQSAIDLVFRMPDDEYLMAFPDTRQLLHLRFPNGLVRHESDEEAETEHLRLKDENARLHAAIWVLRDNPTLQADATVAAIFRLNDEQFKSKFHISLDEATPQLMASLSTTNERYRNNNKTKLKTNEQDRDIYTTIQFSGKPIKLNSSFSRRTRSASAKASQCSQVPFIPITKRRKRERKRDFTSNWKPSSSEDLRDPRADQPSKPFRKTSLSPYPRGKAGDAGNSIHFFSSQAIPSHSSSQTSTPDRGHSFQKLKRSNTVCGMNDPHYRAHRQGQGHRHANEESLREGGRQRVTPLYLYENRCERRSRREQYCRRCYPLFRHETINSNEGSRFVEPSKRLKRDIRLSPVLDPRASFNRLVLSDNAASLICHSASTSDVPHSTEWRRNDSSNNNTFFSQRKHTFALFDNLIQNELSVQNEQVHLNYNCSANNQTVDETEHPIKNASIVEKSERMTIKKSDSKSHKDLDIFKTVSTEKIFDPSTSNGTDSKMRNGSFSSDRRFSLSSKRPSEYVICAEGLKPSMPAKGTDSSVKLELQNKREQPSRASLSRTSFGRRSTLFENDHLKALIEINESLSGTASKPFQRPSEKVFRKDVRLEDATEISDTSWGPTTSRLHSSLHYVTPAVADFKKDAHRASAGSGDFGSITVEESIKRKKGTMITLTSEPRPPKPGRYKPYSLSDFHSVSDFLERQRVVGAELRTRHGPRRKSKLFQPRPDNITSESETPTFSSGTNSTKSFVEFDEDHIECSHKASIMKYKYLSKDYLERWPLSRNPTVSMIFKGSKRSSESSTEAKFKQTDGSLKECDNPKNQLKPALKLLKRLGTKQYSPALAKMLKQAHPAKPYTPPPGSGTWIKGTAPP